MKGLILSGGAGTRLRPITHTSAKQLVPVANKPVLFYGLEAMRAAGIDEVGIVVGETHAEIEAAVGDGSALRARASPTCRRRRRSASRTRCSSARPSSATSPFVMYLGDNLLKEGIAPFVRAFEAERARRPHPPAEGRRPAVATASPSSTATAAWCGSSRSRPSRAATSPWWASTSSRRPSSTASRPSRPRARGELEITDAIQHMVDRGLRVEPHMVHRLVEGHRQARGHARGQPPDPQHHRARRARRRSTSTTSRAPCRSARAARLERCTVRGPVVIGAGCRLSDTFVGPVHVHQRRRRRRATPRSSTPSSSRTAASRTWARA